MHKNGLSPLGKSLVFVAAVLWLVVFAAGLCINSQPYRDAIASATWEWEALWAWFVVITCYTPTNIAVLAGFAGLLGALGAKATLQRRRAEGEEPSLDLVNPYLSALIRSFLVYLALLSGVLILIEDPFTTPTPEQYVRLAGFVSVLGFLVNYRIEIFGNIIERLIKALEGAMAARGGRRAGGSNV
ncbi:MAG: hypothetical protein JSW71_12690 [Gemmatimonadota bacterium]|nr:MAG: hypothetical protein JSW71_12690 [Gemmatimonadota bacterium]